MNDAHSPKQNELLAGLPDEAYSRLAPHLEWVDMPLGRHLHGTDTNSGHLYFPTTSVVSLLQVLDGTTAGIAIVGREGMVGVALFIGGATTPERAVVQWAGEGTRIEARVLTAECQRAGPMLDVVLGYTNALLAQIVRLTLCNREHDLRQRFCRWLLASLDRVAATRTCIDLQVLADVLSSPSDAVYALIRQLESKNLVSYGSLGLELLDRATVERLSCGCFAPTEMR